MASKAWAGYSEWFRGETAIMVIETTDDKDELLILKVDGAFDLGPLMTYRNIMKDFGIQVIDAKQW